MNKRGSVLIVFLWVTVLFALFALSIAFRTRLAVKIEGYEMARAEKDYQLLTGVNLARFFIDSDDNRDTDSPFDDWYGNPKKLDEMEFSKQFNLKIADEDSKLDINKAQEKLLIALFDLMKKKGYKLKTDPKKLAGSILAWRGMYSMSGKPSVGFKNKNAPFESLDELNLIQDIKPEDAELIKPFLTVYAKPSTIIKVNINTVDPIVLEAIISSLIGDDSNKQKLFERIQAFREGKLESQDAVEGAKQYFRREDLRENELLNRLGLRQQWNIGDWRLVQLTRQLLMFLKSNSDYYSVEVTPKDIRGGNVKVRAVLGQRFLPRMMPKPGALSLGKPRAMIAIPLEILSWQESKI